MPNNKKSHKDTRALVCLICFSKGSGMTEVKKGTVTLNKICKFFLKSFDLSNFFLMASVLNVEKHLKDWKKEIKILF